MGMVTMFDEKTTDKKFMAYRGKLMKTIGVTFASGFLPYILKSG